MWWRKFLDLFRRKKEESVGYGEAPSSLVWGFIIPHTKEDGGATTPDKKMNEYRFKLAMIRVMDLLVPFETRDVGGVWGAVKRLFKRGVTASIESHKNAYNKKVGGFEVLYLYDDELSKEYALKLVAAFKEAFPNHTIRRGNGLIPIKKGGRGFNNLKFARKKFRVSLLVEAFFIDNNDDYISPEEMAQFWDNFLK